MNTADTNKLLGDYRYFERLDGGWINLWNSDECEQCGDECEGPNAAKVTGPSLGHRLETHPGLTERSISETVGELSHSDYHEGAVCPACYEAGVRETRKHEHYEWTVKITVAPVWVADGFDLDDDRLRDIISRELGYAHSHEYGAKVLTTPDADAIRAEQSGRKVGNFTPRMPEDE